MNRRSFFASLAGLFGVGATAQAGKINFIGPMVTASGRVPVQLDERALRMITERIIARVALKEEMMLVVEAELKRRALRPIRTQEVR